MSKSNWSDKRDANEAEIIAEFRKHGALVIQMPRSAGYDLQVHFGGFSLPPIEVKNPKSKWKLTESEAALIAECDRRGIEYTIIQYAEAVKEIIEQFK